MAKAQASPRPGHRARLRQRFLAGGPRAFLDHEILEMLLGQVDQRRDTKPRAYALIDGFRQNTPAVSSRPPLGRDLAGVLLQRPSRLSDGGVSGVGPAMAIHLSAVRSAAARLAEASLLEGPVLGNWEAVMAYCHVRFAGEDGDRIYTLFLDYRHRLMREPSAFEHDIDPDSFARRAIAVALRQAASGVIVVRHGSGSVAPVPEDFARAERLKASGGVNAISLHDYMVIAPSGHLSLRSMGMLEVGPAYLPPPPRLDPASDDALGWHALPDEDLDRLQRRAQADGADSLDDRSLLALLLRRAIGDAARFGFADHLLTRFNGLGRLFAAPLEEIADAVPALTEGERPDSPETLAVHLGVIAEAAQRALRGQVLAGPLLDQLPALVSYCRAALAYQEIEEFRVLFLDGAHRLIWDEVLSRGTVNHAPVQPREVAARALRLEAEAIVLVHNHPTGEAEPSRADIDMTRQIVEACGAVGIAVLDHLIVAQAGHTSLAAGGLLPGQIAPAVKARQRKRQRRRA